MAYAAAARARWGAEPPKRAGAAGAVVDRSDFARDRARVLHSFAFRRLADKTQVVAPGEDDFPRTRLTHSLEVAQIGREIAAGLGCDPDVVDAAGLAHDIGHPPFGHNGESALDVAAADCGGFEGNAQTLRVLTRLEARTPHAGLNLTRAVLDATCKYPWPRADGAAPGAPSKYGHYGADAEAFAWVRDGAPVRRRCLEAQIMDWADDVAYSVHDVEDGVHAGLVRLAAIDDPGREQLCAIAAAQYSAQPGDHLAAVLDALLELPTLKDLGDYDGSMRAQVAAKRATSELVGRFAAAAVVATRAASGGGRLARYDADLVVPAQVAAECALLKSVAAFYVMRRPGVERRQAGQRLLAELVAAVHDGAPATLDRDLRPAWDTADDAGRLRVVIDQVAQLTDTSARARHARLVRPD